MNSPFLRIASRGICWFGIVANILFAYMFLMKPDWWLYEEIFEYSTDLEKVLWFAIVLTPFPIAATAYYISKK